MRRIAIRINPIRIFGLMLLAAIGLCIAGVLASACLGCLTPTETQILTLSAQGCEQGAYAALHDAGYLMACHAAEGGGVSCLRGDAPQDAGADR